MPEGLVRSGNFSQGNPVPATDASFDSNPVPAEHDYWDSNPIPLSDATLDSNPVTWTPSPTHFGNVITPPTPPSPPAPSFAMLSHVVSQAANWTDASPETLDSTGAGFIAVAIDSYDQVIAASQRPLFVDGFGAAPTIVAITSYSASGSDLIL